MHQCHKTKPITGLKRLCNGLEKSCDSDKIKIFIGVKLSLNAPVSFRRISLWCGCFSLSYGVKSFLLNFNFKVSCVYSSWLVYSLIIEHQGFFQSDSSFCRNRPNFWSMNNWKWSGTLWDDWNMAWDKTLFQKVFPKSKQRILEEGFVTWGALSCQSAFSASFWQRVSPPVKQWITPLTSWASEKLWWIWGEVPNYQIPQSAEAVFMFVSKLAEDTSLKSKHIVSFLWWVPCQAKFAEIWEKRSSVKELEEWGSVKCWDCVWPTLSSVKHSLILRKIRPDWGALWSWKLRRICVFAWRFVCVFWNLNFTQSSILTWYKLQEEQLLMRILGSSFPDLFGYFGES